jgi:hypothetical protein
MITLLFGNKFPQKWEPSSIWYLAGVELLFLDAPLLGVLVHVVAG